MPSQAIPSYAFWQVGPAFVQYYERKMLINDFLDAYFPTRPWAIFSNAVFYLDTLSIVRVSPDLNLHHSEMWSDTEAFDSEQVSFAWKFLACEIRAYGGIVVDSICQETTHILISDKSRVGIFRTLNTKFDRFKRVLLQPWVSQCIVNKGLIDEARFNCQ
jgi:hypothetical protein